MNIVTTNHLTPAAPVVLRSVIPPPDPPRTPWQKVLAKFGMPIRELARLMGRDHSNVLRASKTRDGVITGQHQRLLIKVAKARGIDLRPEDLVPEV